MKYSKERVKMIHKCRLTGMINRHENRNRERNRIYQIRQSMAKEIYSVPDPDLNKN